MATSLEDTRNSKTHTNTDDTDRKEYAEYLQNQRKQIEEHNKALESEVEMLKIEMLKKGESIKALEAKLAENEPNKKKLKAEQEDNDKQQEENDRRQEEKDKQHGAIIKEMEEKMKALETEMGEGDAKDAETIFMLTKDVRELNMACETITRENFQLKTDLEAEQRKSEELKKLVSELRQSIDDSVTSHDSNLAANKTKIDELEKQLSENIAKASKLEDNLEAEFWKSKELEKQIAETNETAAEREGHLEANEAKTVELKKLLAEATDKAAMLEVDLAAIKAKFDEAGKQLAEKMEHAAMHEGRLEANKTKVDELEKQLVETTNETAKLKCDLEANNTKLGEAEKELADKTVQAAKLERDLKATEAQFDGLEKMLTEQTETNTKLEADLEAGRSALAGAKDAAEKQAEDDKVQKDVLLEGLRRQRIAVDRRMEAEEDEAEAKTANAVMEEAHRAEIMARKDVEFAAGKVEEFHNIMLEREEKAELERHKTIKTLTITVKSAEKLSQQDTGIFGDHSDAYVVLVLKDVASKKPEMMEKSYLSSGDEKYHDEFCNDPYAGKTKVVWDTLDPVWNEDFIYQREHPEDDVLYFHIWDYDDGVHDHSLGDVTVHMKDIMKAGTVEKGFTINNGGGKLHLRLSYHEDLSAYKIAHGYAMDAMKRRQEWKVKEQEANITMLSEIEERTATEKIAHEMEELAEKNRKDAAEKMKHWLAHRHKCEAYGLAPMDDDVYKKKAYALKKRQDDIAAEAAKRRERRADKEETEKSKIKKNVEDEASRDAIAKKEREAKLKPQIKQIKCGVELIGDSLKGSGEQLWTGIESAKRHSESLKHTLGVNCRYIQCREGKIYFYKAPNSGSKQHSSAECWRFDKKKS